MKIQKHLKKLVRIRKYLMIKYKNSKLKTVGISEKTVYGFIKETFVDFKLRK